MKLNLMKIVLKVLFLSLIVMFGCNKKEQYKEQNVELTEELKVIMNNGVTIDSVIKNYATIFTNKENFYVIRPKSIEDTTSKDKMLIYFKFISKNRDELLEFYSKKENEYNQQGYTVDWIMKYYDKLEDIIMEVKKTDDEFYQAYSDSSLVKFFETPDINSGNTFAMYEKTKNEFILRYKDSFPDTFTLMIDNSNKSDSYNFKITFIFNHNKKFILYTDKL
jgi:hypothetical protein